MFDANELAALDPLDLLELALKRVAEDVPAYDVVQIHKLSVQLEYQAIRSAGEMDRSGRWQIEGNLSGPAWLKNHCNINGGTASATLKLSKKLDRLEVCAQAFSQGGISRAHADVMARAFTPSREDAVLDRESVLNGL